MTTTHCDFTKLALRRLRMRHIELLDCLGQVATVRQASEMLSLSQPATTKLLQEIEEACGTRLFSRGRRGIEANPQGLMLIRHAQGIVQRLDHAGQQLQALATGSRAVLNVGASSTLPLLSRSLARLNERMPDVMIRIIDDRPRFLGERLLQGELDCILAPLPPELLASPDIAQLHLEPITTDSLCVVASEKHPLAKRRKLGWPELMQERWVLFPPDALTRQRFIEICLQHGLTPPSPAVECISFTSVRWLLHFNPTLLAVLRHHQAIEEVATGKMVILPVKPNATMPDVSFITRKDCDADPGAMAALVYALRSSFAK